MTTLINQRQLEKLNTFLNNIKPYLKLWRIGIMVDINARLVCKNIEQTGDSINGFIYQIVPEIQVNFYQKEVDEFAIEMPYIPKMIFKPTDGSTHYDYHEQIIIDRLKNAPSLKAWQDAEKDHEKDPKSNFEVGDIREPYYTMIKDYTEFMTSWSSHPTEFWFTNEVLEIQLILIDKFVGMSIINIEENKPIFRGVIDGFKQDQIDTLLRYYLKYNEY